MASTSQSEPLQNIQMEIDTAGNAGEEEEPLVIGRSTGVKKMLAVAADCFKQDQSDLVDSRRGGPDQLTIPGARIGAAAGLMRGHGTFLEGDSLYSSLAGVVVQTNKLIRVRPTKSRYQGEVGDVVVGRILEVQQKRWRVDVNSRLHAALLLTSVNLPGGELRRKSIEDELLMREYLQEGDLVSAEVQQCFHDGALSLQTRSLKYGKLGQGLLLKVLPHLVRRRKTHFHQLPFGAAVILGCNGYIWVSRHKTEEEQRTGGYIADTVEASLEQRDTIARTANCIKLLARNSVPLYDGIITLAFHASMAHPAKSLICPQIADAVAQQVIVQCMAQAAEDGEIPMQI